MKLETLTDTLGLSDLKCLECGEPAPIVSVISFGGLRVLVLCDGCLERLRGVIRKTRGRRPLSPRCRRGLAVFGGSLEVAVDYSTLAGSIGKYATNVIRILLERKLLELEPAEPAPPFKRALFRLTPAGAAAASTLELAAAGK